jgi:TetR/AcrR family transcriptional regulator, lmrAB and yxaGH operons repressor
VTNVRDNLIEATSRLLEAKGYAGTGLSEILKASKAPKGSLYHYFPGGKDELVAAAVARAGERTAQRIRENLERSEPAAAAVGEFVQRIAQAVESSDFSAGGPLQIVALETASTNPRSNQACQQAYRQLQAAFAEKLLANGRAPDEAERLAVLIMASIEGGIILSRTYRTGDPLRLVAEHLMRLIGGL